MSAKDKLVGGEIGLVGRVVSVTCRDRAESEWTDVRLTALNEQSAIIEWEARGVFHQTMIPRQNISHISLKYNNGSSPTETKTV